MLFIDKHTISSIETLENRKARLRLYKNGKIVFEKVYNTFRGAKHAETVFLKYGLPDERF